MINAITIDVEEYFHPAEVQRSGCARAWDRLPSRVDAETERVLELLRRHSVTATFFVLGWVAEKRPEVVRKIAAAGHEIGSHGYAHQIVYTLSPAEFRTDVERASVAIESACGVRPRSYRAPSFSITRESWWALEVLVECGFRYDSSIVPISHDRYGVPGFSRFAGTLRTASGPIIEIPAATAVSPNGAVLPVGGGGVSPAVSVSLHRGGHPAPEREGRAAGLHLFPSLGARQRPAPSRRWAGVETAHLRRHRNDGEEARPSSDGVCFLDRRRRLSRRSVMRSATPLWPVSCAGWV
jgi:polysaccharide deacetylase family protein (PEP-CTERM system associated)